ncbi:hypothetical protein MKX01_031440 [Papaver californicum]|nr:hypothetical protein MKX01_031440 [Papaver californicum]
MHTLVFNLLLLLLGSHLSCFHVLLVPVSAKVFISIDCGSSSLEPYTDERSIEWVGDSRYIKTGEVRKVVTKNIPDGWDSRVMSTLREFSTRHKDCYSLDVKNDKSEDISKVERVLLRASFYYGNYDNKSNPPAFDIQFNGNKWASVETSMIKVVYKEVVYSLNQGNTITVCLAQTTYDTIPFISALEVRSLDSDIYGYVDSSYPLIFTQREAYGTSTIVRYPEDSCDRIWDPIGVPLANISDGGVTRVKNTSPSIEVDIAEKVPEALFTTTLMLKNISRTLWISHDIEYFRVPMNFNVYISEVIKLNSTQKRSFNITAYTDGWFQSYGHVIPPYGQALQVGFENVTVDSDGVYEIDLYATKDSNLPPLINALEAYILGDKLVQGTNSKDVNSLALLQKSFIQLHDWQGDPCLPSPYTWDWVACDSDKDSPRVIALYLNDSGLVGTLPDFSAMDALRFIDLHNNSLTLAIPDFLGTFPKLDVLNLADNNFSGAVPFSILNNTNLKFIASGNPNLSITNNTFVDRNSTESRIPSSSNYKNSVSSTIPIIILGSAIIQTLCSFLIS